MEVEDDYAPGPPTHASAASNRHTAYDERPAMGRGRYTPSEDQMAAAAARRPQAMSVGADDGLPAPPGWPADLPVPEPLSGAPSAQRPLYKASAQVIVLGVLVMGVLSVRPAGGYLSMLLLLRF